METTVLSKIIEDVNVLDIEEKEYLINIMNKQIIEEKRNEIAKRAIEAINNYEKGNIKRGSGKELYEDLEND